MPHGPSCRKWRDAAASSWLAPASRVALLPWVSGSGPPSVCDGYCLSIEVLQVRCVFACGSLKRAHHPASRQRRTSAEHLAALERPACLQTMAGLCQTSTSQSAQVVTASRPRDPIRFSVDERRDKSWRAPFINVVLMERDCMLS